MTAPENHFVITLDRRGARITSIRMDGHDLTSHVAWDGARIDLESGVPIVRLSFPAVGGIDFVHEDV